MVKINFLIAFTQDINLYETYEENNKYHYELINIIIHHGEGGSTGGHYTSIIKKDNVWF